MTVQIRKHRYEVASAISKGQRDHQEDAMAVDFPKGSELGYAVLADGMGGHAAGDVASKIVVTEVFSDLKLQSGNPGFFENHINRILREAALSANECVRDQALSSRGAGGMGTTLVASVLIAERLYWISIGDSPLYVFRQNRLSQVNEDHSMAAQIDFMARSGLLTEEERVNHPDRHCLSSGIVGRSINKIDCPEEPLLLQDGDIVVVASDGLQSLDHDAIAQVLDGTRARPAAMIVDALMHRLHMLGNPDQDNVALTVIKFRRGGGDCGVVALSSIDTVPGTLLDNA